jgi:heme/copper-type cytochrome/quinol oxidase subunit 3
MMMFVKRIALLSLAVLTNTLVFAQQTGVKAEGFMRSNGRSYVVVAVMLTILAGLIFYIIRIDSKLSKLEKE